MVYLLLMVFGREQNIENGTDNEVIATDFDSTWDRTVNAMKPVMFCSGLRFGAALKASAHAWCDHGPEQLGDRGGDDCWYVRRDDSTAREQLEEHFGRSTSVSHSGICRN